MKVTNRFPITEKEIKAAIEGLGKQLDNVEFKDICFKWYGRFDGYGYGLLHFNSRSFLVHRLVAIKYNIIQDYTDEKLICHKCNNKWCINPNHLYAGNHSTNTKDTVTANQHHLSKRTHCKNGHEFSVTNTRYERGHRVCKACRRNYMKKYYSGNYND